MVSFLVINYFTSNFVIDLVRSIDKYLIKVNKEVLIFDNSNDKLELSKLQNLAQYDFIHIFHLNENIGFVKANNYLVKKCKGSIITLINPDTLFFDDSFLEMLEFLKNNLEISLIGPKLLNEDYTYQVSFFKFPRLMSVIKEHIFLSKKNPYTYRTDINTIQYCEVIKGACMVLKKEILENDKVFDEDYIMYSEETDLCFNLKKKNRKVVYFPNSKIIHFGKQSSSLDISKEYSIYHYYRSKFILFKKHYSKLKYNSLKIVLLISLIERVIIFLFLNKKDKSNLFYRVLKKLLKDVKNCSNL